MPLFPYQEPHSSTQAPRTAASRGRITTCVGCCCGHSFCAESQKCCWCLYWLSVRWVTLIWMAEADVQLAISERLGGAKPDYCGYVKKDRNTGGFEYRFILRQDSQMTAFSQEEMYALGIPPTTFRRHGRHYPEECFAVRFSCCLRKIRGPLVDIVSGMGERGAEIIGSASLCTSLQQKLSLLPAVVA